MAVPGIGFLDGFESDSILIDQLNPQTLPASTLPWMTHHQNIAPSDLPQAPGPLVYEGYVPDAFPANFTFANDDASGQHNHQPYSLPILTSTSSENARHQEAPSAGASEDENGDEATGREISRSPQAELPAEDGVFKSTRGATVGRPRRVYGKKRGRPKGSGTRGGWSKGLKLGPRPTLEPSDEFNRLHQQAMDAFIDQQDPERAHELIISAIGINPEIFSAHALLCEIYLSQGLQQKAVSALWIGAHAFPRDPTVWQQLVDTCLQRTSYNRRVAWEQAAYGLHKLCMINPDDHDTRFQYAAALREIGKSKPATSQLKRLFKAMPFNSSCLKLYAQCASDLGKFEWAIESYEEAITHYKETGLSDEDAFEWTDVNIYTDLLARRKEDSDGTKADPVENITEAIKASKRLSRWLLGRAAESYWDKVTDDDREWDAEDEPRRVMIDDFKPNLYQHETYGLGLPLEIRAQLGILRIRLGGFREEALAHFEWLEPYDTSEHGNVHQFPDLFLGVAAALNEAKEHQEALRFYEALLRIKAFENLSFYLGIGASSYICGKSEQAMNCFEDALKHDADSIEAKTYMSRICADMGMKKQAFQFADDAVQAARAAIPQARYRQYERKEQKVVREAAEAALKRANDMPGPRPQISRKRRRDTEASTEFAQGAFDTRVLKRNKKRRNTTAPERQSNMSTITGERVRQLYDTLQYNTDAMRAGNEAARSIWMECAKDLIAVFLEMRPFFPNDLRQRFTSYNPPPKKKPSAAIDPELSSSIPSPSRFTADSPLPSIEPPDQLETITPSDFHSIDFSDWLHIFLEYALLLANQLNLPHHTRKEASSKVIRDTLRCVIWHWDHPSLLRIHTCWLAIALQLHDENTLFNTILRWFIKEYAFCTDAYRLFSAINLLYPHSKQPSGKDGALPASTFQAPTTQKFLFRHLASLDYYLPSTYHDQHFGPVPSFMRQHRQETLALPTHHADLPSSNKIAVSPQEMDVVLLALYGQITYASGAFVSALQYFFRARALDPHNPLVLLSIALCYMHEAFKQRSCNRGMEVLQGWAVFGEYEAARIKWARERDEEGGEGSEEVMAWVRREVEFNRARCWVLLGMGDLAVRTLEGLLESENDVDGEGKRMVGDGAGEREEKETDVDWEREAAYTLAAVYASHGDAATARVVAEKYLVVE